jgi:hypothetical protein
MIKILTLYCIMLNLVLFAQQTKSLVYSNPLIGGNESVWMLARSKEGFLVCAPGICLPSTVGCTSMRNYSKTNDLLWEKFFDTIGPGSFDGIKFEDQITYLTLWNKTQDKDQDFLYKLDSIGNVIKIVQIDEDTVVNLNKIVKNINIIRDTIVLTHAKWISPGPDSVFFLFYDKDLNPLRRLALTENRKWDIALGIHGTLDGNFIYSKHFKSETDFYDDSIGVYKLRPDGSTVWKYKQGISFNNTPFRDFLVINSDSTSSFFTNIEKNFNDKMKFPNFPIITKLSNDGDTIWVCRLINKDYKVIYKMEGDGKDEFISVGFYKYVFLKPDDPKTGQYFGWISKLDKDGKLKWSRNYTDDQYGKANCYLYDVTTLDNGDIIAAGELDQKQINPPSLSWVLHLDSMGCLTPGCTDSILYTRTEEINGQPITKEVFFKAYPNPVVNELKLEFYNHIYRPNSEVVLTDASGKVISKTKLSKGDSTALFSMYDQLPGLYYVSYVVHGKVLQTEKVVKE